MNRIDDLYKNLCSIELEMDNLSKQRTKIRKEIAVLACPYNIGDILVFGENTGKHIYIDHKLYSLNGFHAVVKNIRAYSETWEMIVQILNKDNSPLSPEREMTIRSTRFLTKLQDETK